MNRRITILSTVSLLFLLLWTVTDVSAQRIVNENGGFEDAEIGASVSGIVNWDYWPSADNAPEIDIEVVADPDNPDNKVLRATLVDITPAVEPWDGQMVHQNIALVEGTRYKFEMRIRAENPEAATVSLDGGSGAQLYERGISGSDWTVIESGTFTAATTESRNATVHLAHSNNANGQIIYIDYVRVIDVDYEEPPGPDFAHGFESLDGIDSWINTTSDPGLTLSLSDDVVEGDSSLEFDYDFVASNDWGGSVDIGVSAPGDADFYADMSDADGISLRYKVTAPINNAQHAAFAFKLADVSTPGEGDDEGEIELWEARSTQVVTDDSGEWQELRMPFSSFAVPSWAYQGNGTLDLDQIAEFQMQVIIGGDGEGNTYEGTILFDDLQLYTDPPPVDNTLAHDFESLDGIASWVNTSSDPGLTLSLSDDAVEGDSSLEFDYDFVADAEGGWGGSVDVGIAAPGDSGVFDDMSDSDGFSIQYKVVEPISETVEAAFALKLADASTPGEGEQEGAIEHWEYRTTQVLTDDSGEWQELRIPFSSLSVPEWAYQGNGELDLDQIEQFEMQVVIGESGIGNTYAGTILFDDLKLYTDEPEPSPVAVGDIINPNGSFAESEVDDTTVEGWSFQTDSDGEAVFTVVDDAQDGDGRALRVDITNLGTNTNDWNVEAVNEPFDVEQGATYQFTVWMKADSDERNARIILGQPESGGWARPVERDVDLTTEWQRFSYLYTASASAVESGMRAPISLNVGGNDDETSIYIDNLSVIKLSDEAVALQSSVINFWTFEDATEDDVDDNGNIVHDGWANGSEAANASARLSTDHAYEGSKSVVIQSTAASAEARFRRHGPYPDMDQDWLFSFAVWISADDLADVANVRGYFQDSGFQQGAITPAQWTADELEPDTWNILEFRIPDGYGTPMNRVGLVLEATSAAATPSMYLGYVEIRDEELDTSAGSVTPREFALRANYPNPFSRSTTIEYDLEAAGAVSIRVYNLLGQEVLTVVDEVQNAGTHRAAIDARNLASGVYVYRIIAGDKTDSKTMMIVR